MPHLSKKISSSVALYEDGSSTSISNLEMDMSTNESRSKEYFYQKSVKAALEANKDINENEDGVTNVTYTDPLPFWVKEVVNCDLENDKVNINLCVFNFLLSSLDW